jgi:hypothetical protein
MARVVREQEHRDVADVLGLRVVPIGTVRLARSIASGVENVPPVIGVSTPPGQMQFARTPCLPYWTASNRVSASTPPLLAV